MEGTRWSGGQTDGSRHDVCEEFHDDAAGIVAVDRDVKVAARVRHPYLSFSRSSLCKCMVEELEEERRPLSRDKASGSLTFYDTRARLRTPDGWLWKVIEDTKELC